MTRKSRGHPAGLVAAVACWICLLAAFAPSFGGARAQSLPTDAVWLLPIETEITPATAQFVRSRVEEANDAQPLAVVFLINTPGGQISAMEDIVDTILKRTQLPTIAVVENAFSAGALIAMSAQDLAMLPGSSIGAALPITVTPTGANPVDEKFNSAVRGLFRSVAEARGRNARVAEGMVDQRIEIPGLSTSEELVTLTAGQAVEFDIADVQATTLADALEQFGYGGVRVERIEPNLTERLGGLLARPLVAALLLAIGVGGVLIEIFTPGFGVPGALGVLALVALAAGTFLATPAGVWDVLLILLGIGLIAAEVLVIPGFGVAGVLGFAAIVVAVFRIFQEQSVWVLGYTTLFGVTLLGLGFWLLPNTRFGRGLMLTTRLVNETGPSTPTPVEPPAIARGERGTALSDLRPAGIARIGDERVDVVTQGDYVRSGSEIEVLRVEGNRVTVREIES